MATRTVSASVMPGRYSFFSAPRAKIEPDPTVWWSRSSERPPVTS